VFIEEPIKPLAPLTPSQQESIEAVVKLKAEDWHTIHRARLEYLWHTREDKLGVTTADMKIATERVHKAALALLDVLSLQTEPHVIAWARIGRVESFPLPPGILAFDLDSIYPIISGLAARAHLVCEDARADHRSKPHYDLTHFNRFVGTLASVYERATGRPPTAGKPKYGGDPNPPQNEFVRLVSTVWRTLPKDECKHPQQDSPSSIIEAVSKSLKRQRHRHR
jgi:hypothetical protein